MTVYIDHAVYGKPNGRVLYCHMTADSIEELHQFAKQCGIKPCWFHRCSKYPHYDVSTKNRVIAVANGAVEIESKELVPIAKNYMIQSEQNLYCI